jgi:hypothetical protein
VNSIGYCPVQQAVQKEFLFSEMSVGVPEAMGRVRRVLRPTASVRAETTEWTIESSERYASVSLVMYWLISSTEWLEAISSPRVGVSMP